MPALSADQHQHGIVFASWGHNPRHGGHKRLSGHGPGVGGVLRPQVVDEKGIQPRHAVPGQPVQVVPDWVVCLVAGAGRNSVQDVIFCYLPEEGLQVYTQLGGVVIAPGLGDTRAHPG